MHKDSIRDLVRSLRDAALSGRKPVFYASLAIGAAAGLAALVLKGAVHGLAGALDLLVERSGVEALYCVLPAAGILLTVAFTRLVIRIDLGHGVSRVLLANARDGGRLPRRAMWAPIAGCAMTVGAGGSAGMEAPVMHAGSAIGSAVARLCGFDERTTIILVGCGSAAAIASIFKAPIAGIVFALEVLLIDSTVGNKLPLIVSAVTGAVVSMLASGVGAEYAFTVHERFNPANLPYYLGLGVVCGFLALHLHKTSQATERVLGRVASPWLRAILGGLALGALIAFLPPLRGEGAGTMRALLSATPAQALERGILRLGSLEPAMLIALTAVLALKPVATGLTTGSGGVGGVFAPSLFMGAIAGFLFSRGATLLGASAVSEPNMTLAGMAALLAAIMHSPFTGVFLIAEITGGYELFVPLLVSSVSAYGVHRAFSRSSVYSGCLEKDVRS